VFIRVHSWEEFWNSEQKLTKKTKFFATIVAFCKNHLRPRQSVALQPGTAATGTVALQAARARAGFVIE
jgi:hypothetical protein